jgi:P-type E1-E2 ATPase
MILQQVTPLREGWSAKQCLCYGAALEKRSEHSVGKALVKGAAGSELPPVMDFKVYPGRGVTGRIESINYLIGNRRLLEEQEIPLPIEPKEERQEVSTIVFLADRDGLICSFAAADMVKPEAAEVVATLGTMGMKMVMVSGDQNAPVAHIAAQVGLDDYRAQTLPTEKAGFVEELKAAGRSPAMVGDGINDAPALTSADIGIAVAKGTDIALESADIVLMRDDLELVPEALRLSRRTFATIRRNLFWALGYNITALPLAFFGLLHPIVCAGAMAVSSLCVVGNSLLLRRGQGGT